MSRYLYGGVTAQHKASEKRLKNAQALEEASHWTGAMYLAGYALECRLKARLMEKYDVLNLKALEERLQKWFDEKEIEKGLKNHGLEHLFGFADIRARMKNMKASDPILKAYRLSNTWNSNWRYDPSNGEEKECKEFIESIKLMIKFVDANV